MKCRFCDSEQKNPCETMGDVFLCPNTTWEDAAILDAQDRKRAEQPKPDTKH